LQISIPEPEQLEAYPAERVKVQNTFIHVASPTPASLERVAQSCPSTHIGRLRDAFNEERGDESVKVLCLEEVLFESMPRSPEPLQIGGMGVPPCLMSPEKLSHPRCEVEWPTPGMLQEMGFPGQAPLAGHPDMNCWPMPPPQLGNYQQMALPLPPMPPPPMPRKATKGSTATINAMQLAGFSGSVLQPNVFPEEAMPMPSEPAPGSAELPSVGPMPPPPMPRKATKGSTATINAMQLAGFSGSVLQPNVFPEEAMPMPSEPAPGSAELPNVGSKGHSTGDCKPCAFLHIKGCDHGAMCKFCHICDSGEKKRRQKAKKAAFRGGA